MANQEEYPTIEITSNWYVEQRSHARFAYLFGILKYVRIEDLFSRTSIESFNLLVLVWLPGFIVNRDPIFQKPFLKTSRFHFRTVINFDSL